MWNVNSKKSPPFWLLVIYGLFAATGVGVQATYNSGVKTTVYSTDPQITTQTYTTTHHRGHHYVPVSGDYEYTHNHNNLGSNGNDNDYQTTVTHQSRGSASQWTPSSSSLPVYSSTSNEYHQPQHEPVIQHTREYHQNQNYHQQHPQQHQEQPQQPIYERQRTSYAGHSSQQSGSNTLQQTANDITDYYTGCPSGHTGQLPYAYDCRRFLNCWKGRGHIQSCSVGTVFNPETLECDRPDKVKCGAGLGSQSQISHTTTTSQGHLPQAAASGNGRAGRYIDTVTDSVDILCPTGSQGLEPHPSDCTKFINCANGNVHIQDCGPGTAFSIPMKVCDYKEKVDCTGRAGGTEVTGSTAEVNIRQDTQQTPSSSPPAGGHHDDLPHTADILCLSGITGLFPYPFDYTKFINCKNGNTAIQNCVQGTAFSISKGYCEPLEQIQKIDHVMYIVSEVSYEYSQTLITCPPGTEGIHLYPFNAEKYVKCVRSQMEVVSCSPSQAFSITRRTCLPLGQVLKNERVRLLSELQKTNSYRNVEEQFDVHTMVYCPMGLTGTYPHPFDGSKYITCGGGRLVCDSCASGKAFSLSRKECDMKEDLDASDRVPQIQMSYGQEWPVTDIETTYGSIDGLTYLMCPPGLNGIFLHPFDCTKYIECSNGATNIETCSNGAVYSISRKKCIPRDKVEPFDRVEYMTTTQHEFSNEFMVQADRDLGISCGPGTFGIYPHPEDCHKYMRCANGRIAVESCPAGQVFSIERSTCQNENEVEQYDRSSYGRGQTNGQTHHAHGGATGTGSGTGATTRTTTTTTTQTGNNYNAGSAYYTPTTSTSDIGCPANANGRYPHPFDCTKFIMCSNGVAHIQSCGPGTAWDKAMEVCALKANVDCSPVGGVVTVAQQPEISCPPGVEGLYMHPYDWHKYLSCSNGYTHVMDCGPGTVFSVTRKICDLEKNVVNTDRCNNGVYSSDYDYTYSQTYNNRDSQTYGSGTNQWSSAGTTQYQPSPHSHTHTQTHTTTQQGSGDRWTNMNVPRPQGSTYGPVGGTPTTWQQHGSNTPTTKTHTTNVWSGTAINVDEQSPSHTVIYEEGSLQPDRNYNQHSYSTPLAPLAPGTGSTSTSTTVYAQPIGSQEASEEVFGSHHPQPHGQYPSANSPPHHNPNLNRQNFTRNIHYVSPANTWVPIITNSYPQVPVITHLMPPLQSPEAAVPGPQPPSPQNRYPYPARPIYPTAPQGAAPQTPSRTHVNIPITRLMPPTQHSGADTGQRPLTEKDPIITEIQIDNYPGQPWPYDNHFEPVPSGSRKVVTVDETNLYGGLQPPFHKVPQPASTPRTFLAAPEQNTQIPAPQQTTTPLPLQRGYPKLSNATIQTFPNQPHYSPAYSEVAHSRNASWTGRKVPQHSAIKPTNRLDVSKKPEEEITKLSHREHQSPSPHSRAEHAEEATIDPEQLPLKEALQLMLRPYLNRSGTVDDDMAAKAQSHIMSLVVPIEKTPEATTTTTTHNPLHANPSFSLPSTTPHQDDVELIIAGEQHSLTTTTTATQPGTHNTGTYYDFQHTTVESQRATQPQSQSGQSHDHDTNWHKNHQHSPSSSKHHHHQHSREFHEKHPHLPNPFDVTPDPSLDIDIRTGNGDCPFNCGNGKCIALHEVCNGVNNCGNRKDEEKCEHLGYEVRLTGGESSNKGRVEVKILGKWGYVCDDKFGLKDADVLCHELGFKMGAMEVRGSSYYPPTDSNAPFNMDEVECKGNETSLRYCDFKGWGVNNCGPDEVVGVVCKVQKLKCPDNYWLCTKSEECIPTAFLCDVTADCTDGSDESPLVCNAPIEYRLEGGRSKNEGRLEIFYRGEWGTVCDDDFSLKEAQVVCNSLGFYGKAQVAKNIYGPGSGPIWLDQVSCLGNETTLDQCSHWTWGENNCQHTEDVGIKCTAGPKPTVNRSIVLSTSTKDAAWHQSQSEQSELDDLGMYQGIWQRSSKAVHQPKQCGHFKTNLLDEYSHPEERVINGSIAKRGRHPWQATIRTRGRGGISSHWCGAVIISKKLILTAAHCLAGYPKGSYFVRVGDHYANIAEASEVDSNIENWYIHEKFRENKHMNNDIAIILLKTALRFNDYVQPICLPEKGSQLEANRMCTISGWGSIKSGTSTPSNILRAAEVPILGEEVCRRKDVYSNAMSEGMFCAGFLDDNVDACDGDSGGPLVCSDDDGETLYGIISWGQHCGYANHPGVYVRVEKYIDWIYEKINLMMQQGKL